MAPNDMPGTGPQTYWWLQQSDYSTPGKWSGTYDDMSHLVSNMSSTNVDAANTAYKSAYKMINDSVEAISTAGTKLMQNWEGDSANQMQQALKNLHASASNLADAANMVQNNLFYNLSDSIRWGKTNMPQKQEVSGFTHFMDNISMSGSPLDDAFVKGEKNKVNNANDTAASNFLNVNGGQLGHIVDSSATGVPDKVQTNLPSPDSSKDPNFSPTSGIQTGVSPGVPNSGANLAGMPAGGPGTANLGGGLGNPNGSLGGGLGTPPGTSGFGPTGVNPAGLPGTGTNGLGSSRLPTGLGGKLGSGSGLPEEGLGTGGIGPGGLGRAGAGNLSEEGLGKNGLGTAPGEDAAATDAAAEQAAAQEGLAGRAATGMNGMPGMPMGGMGGGGGGQKQERERTTWLTEDEDVWGGSDGDVAPPVIG